MTSPPFVQIHIWLSNVLQVYLKRKVKIGHQNRTRSSVLGRQWVSFPFSFICSFIRAGVLLSLPVEMGNWVLRFGWWHGGLLTERLSWWRRLHVTDCRKRALSILSGYPRGNGQQRDQRSHQGFLTNTDVIFFLFHYWPSMFNLYVYWVCRNSKS